MCIVISARARISPEDFTNEEESFLYDKKNACGGSKNTIYLIAIG